LFVGANLFGLWLIVSLLRSSRRWVRRSKGGFGC
jgi:hypothetical protein